MLDERVVLKTLQDRYPSMKIYKRYPNSGQKYVFLVNVDEFGDVMLKIVKKMDERVQREIDLLNNYEIPGVPRVLDFSQFTYNGETHYYILEEYIKGQTLNDVMKKGPIGTTCAMNLFEALLRTVVKLEEIKVVHRDIKPDNIICAEDGSIHLIDFGIARNLNLPTLTIVAGGIGPHTPGYGAPELFQYDKARIDSRADLFSIGIVMYQAIFGKHPFLTGKEADCNEIWYRTVTITPEIYMIEGDRDGRLLGLILTMMQKQASKRPPSAKRALEWFMIIKSEILSST